MRRNYVHLAVLVVTILLLTAGRSDGQQRIQFSSPVGDPYVPPPSAMPYTSPGTAYPPPTTFAPPAAMPAAAQPQAMQNLVGDTQRFGMPFDPYAQPAQYAVPAATPYAPPPTATPYYSPPPTAVPAFAIPGFPTSWGGFYAGFEATVLEARIGRTSVPFLAGDFPLGTVPVDVPITSLEFVPDYDLEFSPRIWVGYKGAAGLGVRGRWWFYDHSSNGTFNMNGLEVGVPEPVDTDGDTVADAIVNLQSTSLGTSLKVNSIDLEGTQDGQFSNWDFQIAGGIRWAKIEYGLNGHIAGTIEMPIGEPAGSFENFTDTIRANSEFTGVGPTIAIAGRRPLLFADGLAFLAGVRLAFLFGNTDASLTTDNAFPTAITNSSFEEHLVQVWEMQVGVEYSRQLQSGARLFGAALLEAQVWEWSSPLGVSGGDLGFFGPTFAVGIAR